MASSYSTEPLPLNVIFLPTLFLPPQVTVVTVVIEFVSLLSSILAFHRQPVQADLKK